ncbi:hypothetical protein NDU88_001595 [Pleurodeles waltl]|uniref:Uncharacterized protein n=1 Tax=Pleurodeles waltl TaxID=8319 RepID=A0AAV7T0Q8_PLEWA|nr:hypothetical protein NDU88_001595 [Pleurodeles waltl]
MSPARNQTTDGDQGVNMFSVQQQDRLLLGTMAMSTPGPGRGKRAERGDRGQGDGKGDERHHGDERGKGDVA